MDPNQIPTSDAARGPIEDASSVIAQDTPDIGTGQGNQAIRNEGLPAGTVVPAPQPVEQSPAPAQETVPTNRDDHQRFEYWQSQHDKVTDENTTLRSELQKAAEIVKYVQTQAQPSQSPNGQPTGVPNQQDPLQKPVRGRCFQ